GSDHGRQEQWQRPATDVVEVRQEPAGRGEHRPGELSEPVERGDAVDRLEARFALVAGEGVARAEYDGSALGRSGEREGGAVVGLRVCVRCFRRDDLARTQTGERGTDGFARAFLEFHPTGRNV